MSGRATPSPEPPPACPRCGHRTCRRGGFSWCLICGYRHWQVQDAPGGGEVIVVGLTPSEWRDALERYSQQRPGPRRH